jgi:hypothetical protein
VVRAQLPLTVSEQFCEHEGVQFGGGFGRIPHPLQVIPDSHGVGVVRSQYPHQIGQ